MSSHVPIGGAGGGGMDRILGRGGRGGDVLQFLRPTPDVRCIKTIEMGSRNLFAVDRSS